MKPVSRFVPTFPIFCAFLLLLAAGARALAGIGRGDVFPPLANAELAGELPLTEGKVVLVDFWASWCAPCKASFPSYARLHREFAAQGLVVVGISVDENEAAYAAFVKRLAPPFAVVRDASQKLVRQVDVPAMPTAFLLDRTGRVHSLHQGFHGNATESELRNTIVALLALPSSP